MTTIAIAKRAPARIAKGKLGVYFAWGAFSRRDGEEFIDSHGDRIPDDELVAGALSLAKSAQLGHEHDGTITGSVPLVMPMAEDIQAALDITSPHAGLIVGFTPTAELAASLDAGEPWQMSIEGTAVADEIEKATIAKSAAGPAHKRTLRKLQINKIDLVRAAAHGPGTTIAIAKRSSAPPIVKEPAPLAKRAPAMTDAAMGHQHLIYDVEEADGGTSYETAAGAEYGHSHPWVRLADGSISIGETAGHTHTVQTEQATMADDITKSLTADLAKARAMIAAAVAMPADQVAFARRLPASELETFIAKSSEERAKLATPIHKSERTGRLFFAGDEALVELAKDADATHVELAKAREDAAAVAIAKAAAAVPHVKGAALIVKAIHGVALTAEERTEAMAGLATVDASIATVCKPVGTSVEKSSGNPAAELDAALVEFAKSKGVSPDAAASEFSKTETARRLYAEAYPLTSKN